MTGPTAPLGLVVIVDDEEIITKPVARLLRRVLSETGLNYRVITSQSPSEVFDLVERSGGELALVISDIMMQPMDGFEFLRKVKARYPNALLLVLTGYADQMAFDVFKRQLELYGYQEKPWDDDQLTRTIRNALDSYRRKVLLDWYVPKEIVEEVVSHLDDRVLEGLELEVTILFLDLRNSTDLFYANKLTPKESLRRLNSYFGELVAVLEKYGGILDKYTGDGLMALFGVPSPSNAPVVDAQNAVLAALEMREAVWRMNERYSEMPLALGIGISTGFVIAGNIGTSKRANYTVLGNDVNIASRLEKFAKSTKDGILISQHTFKYVQDIVETRPYDPLPAKGERESVPVYEILGRPESLTKSKTHN